MAKEPKGEKMRKMVIDNKEYEIDALSDGTKTQLVNLRIVDKEIERLKIQLGIAQTARSAIAAEIKSNLPA